MFFLCQFETIERPYLVTDCGFFDLDQAIHYCTVILTHVKGTTAARVINYRTHETITLTLGEI